MPNSKFELRISYVVKNLMSLDVKNTSPCCPILSCCLIQEYLNTIIFILPTTSDVMGYCNVEANSRAISNNGRMIHRVVSPRAYNYYVVHA